MRYLKPKMTSRHSMKKTLKLTFKGYFSIGPILGWNCRWFEAFVQPPGQPRVYGTWNSNSTRPCWQSWFKTRQLFHKTSNLKLHIFQSSMLQTLRSGLPLFRFWRCGGEWRERLGRGKWALSPEMVRSLNGNMQFCAAVKVCTIVLGEQMIWICTRGWADHDHDEKRQCACWNHLL